MWIGDLARLLNDVANAAPVLVPVTIASGQSLSSAGPMNGFKAADRIIQIITMSHGATLQW
jgi:hypothetical protein